MGSSRPPNWSFAARAAYFGDLLCPFCDHRNPAGAKFCNDCASPLHLKPCKHCDAVNHVSATACYRCGEAYPVPLRPEPAPASRASEVEPALAGLTATLTPSNIASTTSQSGWRSIKAGQLVLAAIVTVLIASAYSVYRTGASPRVANRVVSQATDAGGYDAFTAKPVAPIAAQSQLADAREPDAATAAPIPSAVVQSNPVESERVVVADPANAAGDADATNRTAAATIPLAAPKHAGAHQRLVGVRRGATASQSRPHNVASARAGAHAAESRNELHAAPQAMMHVSLARCGGDVIARIVCEQRVRRRFCEGRWGDAPECSNGLANEHRR